MPAVETLGSTTVICSDKTGTLTRGEMTIRRLHLGAGVVEVTGSGYAPEGELGLLGGDSRRTMARATDGCCWPARCATTPTSSRTSGQWTIRGDPTEGAFLVLAGKAGVGVEETRARRPRCGELPFSSERKRMTTVHSGEEDTVAFMKGAPEVVLEHCSHIAVGDEIRPLDDGRTSAAAGCERSHGRADALRVLALAYRKLDAWPLPDDAKTRRRRWCSSVSWA